MAPKPGVRDLNRVGSRGGPSIVWVASTSGPVRRRFAAHPTLPRAYTRTVSVGEARGVREEVLHGDKAVRGLGTHSAVGEPLHEHLLEVSGLGLGGFVGGSSSIQVTHPTHDPINARTHLPPCCPTPAGNWPRYRSGPACPAPPASRSPPPTPAAVG